MPITPINTNAEKSGNMASSSQEFSELKNLLEQNLELTKSLAEDLSKVKTWVSWQKVFGVLKILLIAIPVILGLIYLPALLASVVAPYQELLQVGNPSASQSGLVNQLLNQLENAQTK